MFFGKAQDKVTLLSDWPQPSRGAPQPVISADDASLTIRYRAEDDQCAVIYFPLCNYLLFGAPNDEALGGHPLVKNGLKHYSVHEIHNSSLIHMLEQGNSVHPKHDRDQFLKGKRHFVFTFQDSTLECVIDDTEWSKPEIGLSGA